MSSAPPRSYAFEISSRVAAPSERVWAHATRMQGVNRELWPLARMTHPPDIDAIDRPGFEPGRRLFRSWILAAGLVPIDYDDLTLLELEPGRRFLECSPMGSQREWEHERTLEPDGADTIVTDRIRFVPRLAMLGPLFLAVFRLAFRLRHRNLRRIFPGPADPADSAPRRRSASRPPKP